jgi:hypothetical protein
VGNAARVTYVSAMSETEPSERSAVGLSHTGADALGRPLPVIRLSASKRDRELIAQMKANCVAFAQAIEREQNCFCWKMQRRRGTFFTRPALAPWEPALTLHAIPGPPSGDQQYLGCRCKRVPVGRRPASDLDRAGARAAGLHGICSAVFLADGDL